ncbi:hypothetical protein M5K25_003225 [Dendrobium thyrsiflorum]|uniref:RRM domain-containing protein n=1 Tax=Dendrobium thyrsiflorum TaxID=117978 RepID=A0ABD0VPK3_DENTH
MSTALDMSLDDLIKKNKSSGANPRGRGRGAGPGPARRLPNRSANRVAPYSVPRAPDSAWQHDLFADQMPAFQNPTAAARATAIETGTKLYISNLDYGVSNEDIKELFSEVGDLKRHSVHYDRSGRSKGTAEVVFSKRADALAAVKRYNNVQLDGKPMKIEIVGTNIPAPMVVPPLLNDNFRNFNPIPRSGLGRGVPSGRSRGGGFGGSSGVRGRGRGRGQGRGRGESVSAADLDADLDKYHSEAMQTN